MKRIWMGLFLLLFAGSANGKTGEFAWYGFQEGRAKAAQDKKLIMVNVYTNWCGWCKKMDRDVFSRADVRGYLNEKFVSIKLNAEDRKTQVSFAGHELSYAGLARAFGVSGYPTVLFLESSGQPLSKVPGYLSPEGFMRVLKYFGEGEYKKEEGQEQ